MSFYCAYVSAVLTSFFRDGSFIDKPFVVSLNIFHVEILSLCVIYAMLTRSNEAETAAHSVQFFSIATGLIPPITVALVRMLVAVQYLTLSF